MSLIPAGATKLTFLVYRASRGGRVTWFTEDIVAIRTTVELAPDYTVSDGATSQTIRISGRKVVTVQVNAEDYPAKMMLYPTGYHPGVLYDGTLYLVAAVILDEKIALLELQFTFLNA